MSKEHFTLDEAIEHCYEVSKKKDICKECADEHLQLAKWLKELKTLRQKRQKRQGKDDTADSGWCLVPPNYAADCCFCRHNEGWRCAAPNGPYETDATTCLAFQDIRLMK